MFSPQNGNCCALQIEWRLPALIATALLLFAFQAIAADHVPNDSVSRMQFFESVLPVLKKHCFECHSHSADSAEGGLVLDSRAGWEVGGDSGPAVVPGSPENSLLLKAVEYSDSALQMPPNGRLPASELAVLKQWIADGAFDPRIAQTSARNGHLGPEANRPDLWSLNPVESVKVPAIDDASRIHNDIDRFILAKLRERGSTPNPPADRYSVLRRATFDLTGLPPSLDAIEDFISDDHENAYDRLIDRLLNFPHYGERWGRHWLDLARYGDSNGGDINYAHANAWKYRDYVIRAFNDDKPYDEFIREQLAGDLLENGADEQRRRDLLTATGFLMLGPKMLAEADTDKLLIDIVDEQLDVTGLTFLAMTFGCARCHDHKFDPISTVDYYAMAGIFRSTKVIDVYRKPGGVAEWLEVDVSPPEVRAELQKLNREKKRLEDGLAELGASKLLKANSQTKASRAILATKIPTVKSTTWAAWVRISTPQQLGAVISATYEGANQGHSLGFDTGSTPRVVWNHGSGTHTIIAAPKPITFDDWHHLALAFDAVEGRLRLFVDGQEAAAASDVETSNFSTISVGRREASQEWQLAGDVDEVTVFDTALDSREIGRLAQNFPPPQRPLIHWTFDRVIDHHVVAAANGGVDGRVIGVAATAGIIRDGAIGPAFSFRDSVGPSTPNAEQRRRIASLRKQISQVEALMPEPRRVMAVGELPPVDLAVHIRGSHLKLASTPIVRSTPKIFEDRLPPVTVPTNENGRLQLAKWISSPENPLTARVMVNRIWQHHFGVGLVRTSSNFGVRGELPSHPGLLDWLAHEFMSNGWSIKHMHRLIMNSATYRQSSQLTAATAVPDPENRMLCRFPVRRLEAEAIRDSLLAVTGELDRAVGGSLLKSENKKRVTMSPVDPVYGSHRRSVYLPSVRVRSYQLFSIFDVSGSGQHVARRSQTMVAQQALFLLNNPFVIDRAEALARQFSTLPSGFDQRSDRLHRILYGRPVTVGETSTLALAFAELLAAASKDGKDNDEGELFAWLHIIHTMLCSNEFIHLR